jgi:hypothetical protein
MNRTTITVFALALVVIVAGCDEFKTVAEIETEATAFDRMIDGDAFKAATCVTLDSDGDGYVTCTVFRRAQEPYAIECTCRKGNHGCKPAALKLRGPGMSGTVQ